MRVLFNCAPIIVLLSSLTFAAAPTAGLIAYWDFNEGAGGVVHDSSGHGIVGTLYRAAWVPSSRGTALAFSAKDSSYVDYGRQPMLNLTNAVTVSTWVKLGDYPPDIGDAAAYESIVQNGDSYRLMWTNNQAAGDAGFSVHGLGFDTITLCGDTQFSDGGVSENIDPATYDTTQWHHLVFTYDSASSTCHLYLDGSEHPVTSVIGGKNCLGNTVYRVPSGLGKTIYDFCIGKQPAAFHDSTPTGWGWNYFTGMLNDIRVYNRVLSVAEISSLYNWEKSNPAVPTVPVLLSPLPGAIDVALDTTFAWSQIAGFTYRVQIALDSNFATMVDDTSIAADTTLHVVNLSSGTGYYWRVATTSAGGGDRFSPASTFTTVNVPGAVIRAALSLSKRSSVRLQLYDTRGRLIVSITREMQDPGEYSHILPTLHLSRGTYIAVLNTGAVSLRHVVAVVK